MALTQSYFDYLSFGVIPMLWITAIQQLFIGIAQPVIVLIYSLIRLPLSILFAYLFIFGKWGLPAFGMDGLGLSISILSAISCLILLAYLFFSVRFSNLLMFRARPKFQFEVLTRIAHLGLPIGIQYSGEIAAYVLAFPLQFGVVGIPIGMATGTLIATVAVQRMYASELKQIVHRN